MPVFEYRCKKCSTKFEILVKSASAGENVTCPACNAAEPKKLFSSFAAKTESGGSHYDNCDTGSCGMNPPGGCASGMCGLN